MTFRRRLTAALRRVPGGLTLGRLTLHTFRVCLDYRVTGLAAEAAFFMLLSLPPLVLGVFGGVGFVGTLLGPDAVQQVVRQIGAYAAQFLTESSIVDILLPTIEEVLNTGRAELVSVGFLLSLWAGSRAINVFVDTISIMYGQKDVRGIVHMRALSLGLYTVGMLLAVIMLPLALLGPELIGRWLPEQLGFVTLVYWPVVVVLSIAGLTSLYHVATPRRGPWWRDIPGALLALAIWLGASVGVRMVLEASLGGSTIYGPLSAPIVLLIWLYTLAIAILIGAGLNAATRAIWPVELRGGVSRRVWGHVSGAVGRSGRRVRAGPARAGAEAVEVARAGDGGAGDAGGDGGEAGDGGDAGVDEAVRLARDQQFAHREKSVLAEAIERELARGPGGGGDSRTS